MVCMLFKCCLEVERLAAFLQPDAWMNDKSNLYVYKPGLRSVSESMGYNVHEAGSPFGEIIRSFQQKGGLDQRSSCYLDKWGAKLPETIYLIGGCRNSARHYTRPTARITWLHLHVAAAAIIF